VLKLHTHTNTHAHIRTGIDYYNELINALLQANIEPFVTLYHWDLPNSLHMHSQGWLNARTSSAWFVQYATVCFSHFGDRVSHWVTFNEPWTFSWLGYGLGTHAPGRCSDRRICSEGDSATEPYVVAHNVLLAHAAAARVYRERYSAPFGTRTQRGCIGLALNMDYFENLTISEEVYCVHAHEALSHDN
jgi:beta-glucosidase